MAEIIFNNKLTYGAGESILMPTLTALFDQDLVSKEYSNDIPMKMGYTPTRALSPDQQFSIIIGAYELDVITEDQDIPSLSFGKGKEKGFEIVQYGGKLGLTKLFRKWLETAKVLDGADSSVKSAYNRMVNDVTTLRRSALKSKNIAATEVLTKWWTATAANGAGSATMYGQPLFSASHPYGNAATGNAGTFSNLLTTADKVFDAAWVQLQDAIDIHKSVLRLQNGDRVEIPTKFTVMCSNKLATTVRKVLNTAGNQVGMYSGQGSNASLLNQFSFNGNTVELVENPFLWFVKKNGEVVGSDDYWFVMNTEAIETAQALRQITLYDTEVNAYQNDSNNSTYISLDMGIAFDHYGLESFIVGSRGTVA